jgi:hypothetical protein
MVILFLYYQDYQAGSIKMTKSPEDQRVGFETTMYPCYSLRIPTEPNMALVMHPMENTSTAPIPARCGNGFFQDRDNGIMGQKTQNFFQGGS